MPARKPAQQELLELFELLKPHGDYSCTNGEIFDQELNKTMAKVVSDNGVEKLGYKDYYYREGMTIRVSLTSTKLGHLLNHRKQHRERVKEGALFMERKASLVEFFNNLKEHIELDVPPGLTTGLETGEISHIRIGDQIHVEAWLVARNSRSEVVLKIDVSADVDFSSGGGDVYHRKGAEFPGMGGVLMSHKKHLLTSAAGFDRALKLITR